jgi:hypothetical protein
VFYDRSFRNENNKDGLSLMNFSGGRMSNLGMKMMIGEGGIYLKIVIPLFEKMIIAIMIPKVIVTTAQDYKYDPKYEGQYE